MGDAVFQKKTTQSDGFGKVNGILPRVKIRQAAEGSWMPKRRIAFCVAQGDTFGQNAVKAMEFFLPGHEFVATEKADVVLQKLPDVHSAEWYRLTAGPQGVLR